MSPWCTSRAIPNLGSSPCPSRRPPTAPSTTGSGGASRPCSRTSRPAASAWRTARSSAPSAWTACFWSWRWPCSGPSRPACGMPSTAPRLTKKSPSAPAPQPPPRPDLALQARHPTTSGLPATSRSAAAAVERVGELMGGKGHADRVLALLGKAGVVDDPGGDRPVPAKGGQHLLANRGEHGRVTPRGGGDEVLQRLVQAGHAGRVETRRHRLDALALARQQEARAIADHALPAVGVAQHLGQPRQVRLQASLAGLRKRFVHAPYIGTVSNTVRLRACSKTKLLMCLGF